MKKTLDAQFLIGELNAYIPDDISEANLFIDELIVENWAVFSTHYPIMLEPCFRFMERAIPEDFDCFSLIHALEADEVFDLTIYLAALFESIDRKPTSMANILLNRLINSDIEIRKCLEKLTEIANNFEIDAYVREDAADYLDYQREKNGNFIE